MTETELYHVIQKSVKGTDLKLHRIETGGLSVGIPDTIFNGDDIHGWIELKQSKRIKKYNKVPWRPGQRNIGRELVNARANLWLIWYFNEERSTFLIPGHFWQNGYTFDQLTYDMQIERVWKGKIKTYYTILTRDQYQ